MLSAKILKEFKNRGIFTPSLVYPSFKLDIEQDEIRKASLVKQETEQFQWFCTFLLIPSILESFS